MTIEWSRKALDGDRDARDALLAHVRPRLVLWAASRRSGKLRAAYEPEDVAQEVLLAVHRDFDRLAPSTAEEVLPWIFGVAENRLRDLVDRIRAAKRNGDPPPAKPVRTPSSVAGLHDDVARLQKAIAGLSRPHRDVLRLRRFEELPTAEVARRLERSEAAVRVLYFRAVAALRDAIS